jgi:hypothetical protein
VGVLVVDTVRRRSKFVPHDRSAYARHGARPQVKWGCI